MIISKISNLAQLWIIKIDTNITIVLICGRVIRSKNEEFHIQIQTLCIVFMFWFSFVT